jgi:hypothetical protein
MRMLPILKSPGVCYSRDVEAGRLDLLWDENNHDGRGGSRSSNRGQDILWDHALDSELER